MKLIVGFSGGIDSQATARWVLNRYPAADVILTNSNAGGNEDPLTDEFVKWYSENVHPVELCNAIVADMWKTAEFAETKGLDSNAPLTFDLMIKLKGRGPSRKAQFCTDFLKLRPQRRWLDLTFRTVGGKYFGEDYERFTGVRRDESEKRQNAPFREWDELFDCWLNAPIADWTKQMCFDYVKAHGERINDLYTLGFNRVGCAPCINSGKDDVLAWSQRRPEMIDKIRGWETSTGRTYFAPIVPGLYTNSIDQVVEWSKTDRGGRQTNFLRVLNDRPACESKYGLCE